MKVSFTTLFPVTPCNCGNMMHWNLLSYNYSFWIKCHSMHQQANLRQFEDYCRKISAKKPSLLHHLWWGISSTSVEPCQKGRLHSRIPWYCCNAKTWLRWPCHGFYGPWYTESMEATCCLLLLQRWWVYEVQFTFLLIPLFITTTVRENRFFQCE